MTANDCYTTTKDVFGNYHKYFTLHYNTAGKTTGWESYYESGALRARKTTTYWEEMGSTAINPKITQFAKVDEYEYDEYGNLTNHTEKKFAAVKGSANHSQRVQEFEDYLAVGSVSTNIDWP